MYYVYFLLNLRKPARLTIDEIGISLLYKPYYVGKGIGDRVLAHRRFKNTKHKKDATTSSILSNGYSYDDLYLKYYTNENEDATYKLEESIISSVGLDNLTNISPGGIGGAFSLRAGKTYEEIYGNRSESIRNKISSSNTGKIHSVETRAKLSKATSTYFKCPENVKKHSEYLTGRKMPESFCLDNTLRFKGVPKSDETRLKMSNSAKGKTQSIEHKANAAFARAKYKGTLTINNISYDVIRSTFFNILTEHDITFNTKTFYNIIKNNDLLKDHGVTFKTIT